jgi:2-amino-4-hydroxy-6-hydroxymethyldihydropteridine diphosphokinase
MMIVIGLGANVTGPWGDPRRTVSRALEELDRGVTRMRRASRLLMTAPLGRPNQPPFVNAVALIATHLPPEALMRRLHAIEHAAGRRRGIRWGPRTLDLDLLDYRGLIRTPSYPMFGGKRPLLLPHPGIAERVFVLQPLAEIAPDWRHPVNRRTARELLKRLRRARGGSEI